MITKEMVYDEKRNQKFLKLRKDYNLPKDGTVHKMNITVTFAKRTLELVPPFQRRLIPLQIKSIGIALTTGEFQFIGDAICFDEYGNCINGQQRLTAVAEKRKSAVCNVTTGLDGLKAYKAMDIYWRKKGFADMLKYQGEQNCVKLSATIVWLFRYNRGLPGNYSTALPTTQIGLDLFEQNRNIQQSLIFGHRFKKVVSGAVAGCCHHLCSQIDKEQADDFFSQLATGSEIAINNPIYQCHKALQEEYIVGKTTRYEKMRAEYKFALIINTWNAWRLNKRLRSARTLYWRKNKINEPFPKPI